MIENKEQSQVFSTSMAHFFITMSHGDVQVNLIDETRGAVIEIDTHLSLGELTITIKDKS